MYGVKAKHQLFSWTTKASSNQVREAGRVAILVLSLKMALVSARSIRVSGTQ